MQIRMTRCLLLFVTIPRNSVVAVVDSFSNFQAITLALTVTIHVKFSQDGWRRLEYEEILAPAPPEESGAGLVGRKESCKYHLLYCSSLNQLTSRPAGREKEA